jgi:RNA polymerase sigma-70 factor (ECF subfamily)
LSASRRVQDSPRPAGTPKATSILAKWEDAALVGALIEGHPIAKTEFFDRYGDHVTRILVRVLGHDCQLADLLHEVFARSLGAIETLEDRSALQAWVTGIAVYTARECIRKRARGRWLRFFASEDLPEVETATADDEVREALRITYGLLDRLGADDRIAFALRFIEGLELSDVAAACGISLNTVKRRLARAERRFVAFAEREPALKGWLQGGTRWQRK